MKTTFKTVSEIIDNKEYCPIPLEVIPNNMGINLCSVDAISWQKQSDGQLTSLTIHFLPEENLIIDPPFIEGNTGNCENI
jgi:hypothetical protein